MWRQQTSPKGLASFKFTLPMSNKNKLLCLLTQLFRGPLQKKQFTTFLVTALLLLNLCFSHETYVCMTCMLCLKGTQTDNHRGEKVYRLILYILNNTKTHNFFKVSGKQLQTTSAGVTHVGASRARLAKELQ